MKKLITALFIALLLTNVSNVLADSANIQRLAGFAKTHFAQVTETETPETEENETETAGCTEYATNIGTTVCLTSANIAQDLTQCALSNNGDLLCVDVCGGMSAPGTICSRE